MEELDYSFLLKTPLGESWSKIGLRKRTGVAIPLFSIRSRKSAGVGEFLDIKYLIDWCNATGNEVIQLLPLNDTGLLPSPFSPITATGLNPLHISLHEMEGAEEEIQRINRLFPPKSHLDYRVGGEKIKSLKKLFLKDDFSSDFASFIEANKSWLNDYALFASLKELNLGKAWWEWQEFDLQDTLFWKWLQWQAFKQMEGVKRYAESKGVLMMGDLPHFVAKDSIDFWKNPHLFRENFTAGAPPDEFTTEGQEWGVPPYNWKAIEREGFNMIKERVSYAENFYHLFRIDHLVGLFRTWTGNSFDLKCHLNQRRRGEKILRAFISSSSMIPCAEDVGIVPNYCRETIKRLGIPGLDIGRGQRDYRQIAVATTSTHDMEPFPEWLKEESLLDRKTLSIINSPSIFAIFPLFDWLFFSRDLDPNEASQYRINTPGRISDKNWSITLPFYIEEILNLPGNEKIARASSRS